MIRHAAPVRQLAPRTAEVALERFQNSLPELSNYDGGAINVDKAEALLKDKNVIRVFHFWASWCDPCLNELPDFFKFVERSKTSLKSVIRPSHDGEAQSAQFILVSLDFDQEGIDKFSQIFPKLKSTDFFQVWDKNNFLSKALGVNKLPMTLVVYPDGRAVSYEGVLDWKIFLFSLRD